MIRFILRRFRRQPSVDDIVANFNKTVRKLEAVATDQERAAQREADAAKLAAEREQTAKIEASRARAVASNLNNLVTG